MDEIQSFHEQLIADVQSSADAYGLIAAESFFEKVSDLLSETGEIDEANRAYFDGRYSGQVLQVDGYGGDPNDNNNVLTLILCDFENLKEVRTINKVHVNRFQNRLYQFLFSSLKSDFREQLEETSVGFGLADLINARWPLIEKVKFIIATNANFSARTDAEPLESIDGKQVAISVWDLKRLKQFIEQGQARADLVIDFESDFGGSIPLLQASGTMESFDSYLAVIPGKQLAEIYDKWGPRLLEANVRSFLQARGKVNRGIRNTIRDEPHMFFSYNNGLSVTADSVDIQQSKLGLELARVNNLQIVNGGQTTATLHSARKTFEKQLDQVFVQMKLTIVPSELSEKIVPYISEYANSQNRVNAADFFSNHPFHIRIEEFSRKILAPAGEVSYRETKWFYERARGQYADERSRKTASEKKKFDLIYPRAQYFTKTDLAKYINTFEALPHVVSLGAQKNFSSFAQTIGKVWGKEGASFDELWFKRLVAKAIVFKTMEKLVSSSDWYEGGYRANIVTYGIAKVVFDLSRKDKVIDLDSVWKNQKVSWNMTLALLEAGEIAQSFITNPAPGIRNSGEWAKKEICWKWLSEADVLYSVGLEKISISKEASESFAKRAKTEAANDESAQATIDVFNLGAAYWKEARSWAYERGIITMRDLSILEMCAAMPRKIPTSKQSLAALSILDKLKKHGFQ